MKVLQINTVGRQGNLLRNLLSEFGFADVRNFQQSNNLEVDGLFGDKSYSALYKHILNPIELPDFAGHFYNQRTPKKQIVWHHSAGWDNARGMFNWWKVDKVFHVATAIGINDAGEVYRGYDEDFWGHHIGMQHRNNLILNMQSVAVEVCNWGALTFNGKDFQSWSGAVVPPDKVQRLSYKDATYYEKYTDEEIRSLKYWTLLMALRYDIDLTYRHDDMWQVSNRAISGQEGIYTHNSYISWKSDVSPQPKLISMAKTLKAYGE